MNDSITTYLDDKEIYYYVGKRRVRLFPDPQLFAVRLEQGNLLQPENLSEEAKRLLQAAQPVAFLPRDSLYVYRSESGLKFTEVLRWEAGIALALPAFGNTPEGGDVVFVTTRLLAQFRPELDAEMITSVLEKLGLSILEPLSYATPNGYLLEAVPGIDGLGALAAANTLVEEGLVVFAEPDLIQSRHWRDGPLPNPSFAAYLDQQWHLKAASVLDAWNDTQGSPSIRIAILDDGLDTQHQEFSAAVGSGQPKVAAQFDFATGTMDASPKTYLDNHGTACAGVAAAVGVEADGVAPGCRLIMARIPDYLGVSDEAKMFQWAADSGADVISSSWGPVAGTGATFPLPTPTKLAIRYCLNNGRVGKGIPIFWAAGNGSELVSQDGYASNPDVMAIAACTAAEGPASYSDFGPEIFACAPSNGGVGQPAIFTTDRRGSAGYNPGSAIDGDAQGDYTNSFGGTSAAAPLAAGIAALALSANPNLPASQVRELLRTTADRIGDPSAYDENGHNDRFGYGRLNAAKMVEAARQAATGQPGPPTILGPDAWSRIDTAPVFQVDPGPHLYYVVEVAIKPELFDVTHHGSERSADSFYGSWSDSPFQTNPTYTLSPAAWARLRSAERLWYRVGASASATGYVDYIVSTPDDQGEQAPSIKILSGAGVPPPSPGVERRTISDLARKATKESTRRWIEGPLRWDRRLGPPTFRIEPDPGAAYKLEVAADSQCFDISDNPDKLKDEASFTSDWLKRDGETGAPHLYFQAYTLPIKAWEALLGASQLYYRLTVQNGNTVTSPIFVMDLTGEVTPSMRDGEGPMRTDEALWRTSRKKSPVKRLRTKRS
jgi:subtilisin family serine protease